MRRGAGIGLESPSQVMLRPGFTAVRRNLFLGMVGAAGMFAVGLARGTAGWNQFSGFLPTAAALALSGWAGERVWAAVAAPLVRRVSGWNLFLAHVPFWLMAGGMGATIGILIAKKYALLDVQDMPVEPFFTAGAYIYAGVQTAVWALTGAPAGALAGGMPGRKPDERRRVIRTPAQQKGV